MKNIACKKNEVCLLPGFDIIAIKLPPKLKIRLCTAVPSVFSRTLLLKATIYVVVLLPLITYWNLFGFGD